MHARRFFSRLLTLVAVMTLLVSSLIGPGSLGVAAAHPTTTQSVIQSALSQFSSPDGDKLLLVHGFNDTCDFAFNQTDEVPNTGLNAISTVQYLTQHGWSSQSLDLIGYYTNSQTNITDVLRYNGDHVPTTDGTPNDISYSDQYGTAVHSCTSNLQELSDLGAVHSCSPLLNGHDPGSINDPIERLGCLLAWYIYDTYTTNGEAVDILAHSMGGLIVRDAIGESGHGTPNSSYFPPTPLNVHVVVTVGTPHGGLYGFYIDVAFIAYNASTFADLPQEIQDMNSDPSFPSPFMNLLDTTPMQNPQGLYGTYWALMASSIPCVGASNTGVESNYLSCGGEDNPQSYPWYGDGDGVVQADSALAMPADFKLLYGAGRLCFSDDTSCDTHYVQYDGHGLEYAHEANTCKAAKDCLGYPFYLNDGSSGTTQGWICQLTCDNGFPGPGGGGIADVNVVVNGGTATSGQAVPHSLAEMAFLLSSQGPGTTPQRPIHNDFNGDGLSDAMGLYSLGTQSNGQNATAAYEWLSTGTGLNSRGQVWSSVPSGFTWANAKWVSGDFSGDSKTDIVAAYNLGNTIGFYEWLGTGTVLSYLGRVYTSGPFCWSCAQFVAGDFNGDGKADIVAIYNLGSTIAFYEWQSTGSGFTSLGPVWTSGPFAWANAKWVTGDFSGDGKADIVAAYNLGSTIAFYEWRSTGSGFLSLDQVWSSGPFCWSCAQFVAGDFNGDGKADIMAAYNLGNGATALYEWQSTGSGFLSLDQVWSSSSFAWANAQWMTGDFNGDGQTDIMAFYNLGSTVGAYEWLSTGNGLDSLGRIYTSGSFTWASCVWVS